MRLVIICICIIAGLGSCGTTHSLERAKLDYELDQLWSEYVYKTDSLIIQYNKSKSEPTGFDEY